MKSNQTETLPSCYSEGNIPAIIKCKSSFSSLDLIPSCFLLDQEYLLLCSSIQQHHSHPFWQIIPINISDMPHVKKKKKVNTLLLITSYFLDTALLLLILLFNILSMLSMLIITSFFLPINYSPHSNLASVSTSAVKLPLSRSPTVSALPNPTPLFLPHLMPWQHQTQQNTFLKAFLSLVL